MGVVAEAAGVGVVAEAAGMGVVAEAGTELESVTDCFEGRA